jgi:2-C-methyl-D-erythritol 4-phosphate cytidylyltransferase
MGGDGPVWAVVVAAGSGERYGAAKQYAQLDGRRVLDWSLAAARGAADGVVLVVSARHAGDPEPAADVVVAGGSSRSESVRAGLDAVPDDAEIIVVHDAARPAASAALFAAVVAAVRAGADGAIPGVAVVDTIKRVQDDVVVETLDRAALVAVQTPQAFRASVLRSAHADGGDATDDGALVEAAGGRVVVVPGEPQNVKLTTPADLERLARP